MRDQCVNKVAVDGSKRRIRLHFCSKVIVNYYFIMEFWSHEQYIFHIYIMLLSHKVHSRNVVIFQLNDEAAQSHALV